MRKVLPLLAAICFLCINAITATATTRVVSRTWQCADGSTGWYRVEINESTGKIIRSSGRDCDGTEWSEECDEGGVIVGTWSNTSTDFYTGASPIGAPYWLRVNVNAIGRISEMWGMATNGTHWYYDIPGPLHCCP